MVFAYTGIVKVLWGSLPTERMFNDEKRTINASEHTLSGKLNLLKTRTKVRIFELFFEKND